MASKPVIEIEYCPKCNWMLRAAYMSQEILSSFTEDIHGVLLIPSEIAGRYTIGKENKQIFERKRAGRFSEIKELKQLIGDIVAPEKSLGHSDKTS